MKKIISILVAAMMIVSLFAVSASAYDIDKTSGNKIFEGAEKDSFGGSTSADVQIEINGGINHRYAVDIIFNSTVFTLSTGATWDPATHEYVHETPVTWTGEGKVTVENHSDMPITYEATAEVTEKQYGEKLAIVFNGATTYAPIPKTQLAGCTVGGTAPSGEFKYGVVGEPIVAELAATKLGIVTVTVDAVD